MQTTQFITAVRDRLHSSVGFLLLSEDFRIIHSEELQKRLPPRTACLKNGYYLLDSSYAGPGGSHPTYWRIWKLDEDFSVVGHAGWIISTTKIKQEYDEEDVLRFVQEIIEVNKDYLSTPLMLLMEGFKLTNP
jgi:hypothetical protein